MTLSYVVRRTLTRYGAGSVELVRAGRAVGEMHILSDANGLPLVVGVSFGNTHDSEGLEPMVEGHQTNHDPHRGRYFKPQRLHADKAYDRPALRK